MLQLKVFTSDMDASRPVTQQWGRYLRMKGGFVILVGCGKYLRLENHQYSTKPNHTLLHYAIGAIPNMVRMNVSGWSHWVTVGLAASNQTKLATLVQLKKW